MENPLLLIPVGLVWAASVLAVYKAGELAAVRKVAQILKAIAEGMQRAARVASLKPGRRS